MASRNAEVVDLLQMIGDLMELRGDESFKVRAYREAARQLDLVSDDIDGLAAEGSLTSVKGVGPSIARTIKEYLDTGESKQLERLRAEVPESLVELLGLRHFGPSRIVKAHQTLGIATLDDLEAAALDGRLEHVPGFGKKSVEALLGSIKGFRERRRTTPRYQAESTAANALHALRQMANLREVEVTGAMRRLADVVAEITLLARSDDAESVVDAFARLPIVREIERVSPGHAIATTREKLPIHLFVASPSLWGQALVVTTGSDAHLDALAAYVPTRGDAEGIGGEPWLRTSDFGLWTSIPDESAFYAALDLPLIPPELREGRGEVEAARDGTLPHLLTVADIRGDLHVHTTWSDGKDTVAQMAQRARDLGREYLGIADHSQSLGVARGLSLARLTEQRREIAQVDADVDGIRLLSGVELDIRQDGSLDYPDEVLAQFDFVTASIHSGFQQTPEKLTERVIQAMRSPHVDAIGHLTGRVLGWRDALEMDVDAIIQEAAETGTALEINAWPNRLDVREDYARRAKELGVKLVINTDAHAADQLDYMHYGVEIARRGWLEPGDVLNALSLDALQAYLASRPHKG